MSIRTLAEPNLKLNGVVFKCKPGPGEAEPGGFLWLAYQSLALGLLKDTVSKTKVKGLAR